MYFNPRGQEIVKNIQWLREVNDALRDTTYKHSIMFTLQKSMFHVNQVRSSICALKKFDKDEVWDVSLYFMGKTSNISDCEVFKQQPESEKCNFLRWYEIKKGMVYAACGTVLLAEAAGIDRGVCTVLPTERQQKPQSVGLCMSRCWATWSNYEMDATETIQVKERLTLKGGIRAQARGRIKGKRAFILCTRNHHYSLSSYIYISNISLMPTSY